MQLTHTISSILSKITPIAMSSMVEWPKYSHFYEKRVTSKLSFSLGHAYLPLFRNSSKDKELPCGIIGLASHTITSSSYFSSNPQDESLIFFCN